MRTETCEKCNGTGTIEVAEKCSLTVFCDLESNHSGWPHLYRGDHGVMATDGTSEFPLRGQLGYTAKNEAPWHNEK